jgi:hypothetical protein
MDYGNHGSPLGASHAIIVSLRSECGRQDCLMVRCRQWDRLDFSTEAAKGSVAWGPHWDHIHARDQTSCVNRNMLHDVQCPCDLGKRLPQVLGEEKSSFERPCSDHIVSPDSRSRAGYGSLDNNSIAMV